MEKIQHSAYGDFRRSALLAGETVLVGDPDYGVGRRHLMFAYGTMKRGFRNHDRIAGRARFVCETVTMAGFTLATKHDVYPAPVAIASGLYRVSGELYEIDGALLQTVDSFEGHPRTYERQRVLVEGVAGYVWMYVFRALLRMTTSDWGIDTDRGRRIKTFTLTV